MKCAVFYGKEKIIIEDRFYPKIDDYDEVLVKVKSCGICGTDVGMYSGRINYSINAVGKIFGHEITGIIEDKGSGVEDFRIGDRVIIIPTISCMRCSYCKTGNENLCPNILGIGSDIDGGYAEYVKVKKSFVYSLPDGINFEEGTLLADCVPTSVHSINKHANIKIGSTVAIWGTGGQGFISLQIVKHSGGKVFFIGRRNEKLELAKKLGADFTINSEKEDVSQRIIDINKEGVDISIETGGYPSAVTQSVSSVKHGGRVIIIGLQRDVSINFEDIVWHEKSIIGSFWSTESDFTKGLQLGEDNVLNLKPLVTHLFKLDQIQDAFSLLTKRNESIIKAVIVP